MTPHFPYLRWLELPHDPQLASVLLVDSWGALTLPETLSTFTYLAPA